jgi:hypothetical protein
MEIFDEYSGTLYPVPPEEELVVLQLQARGATVPEIVDALMLPAPEAEPEKAHGYVPSNDGFVVSVDEVEELGSE